MSKAAEKKIQCQNSIWYTLKKATTKNSEWPDKVRRICYLGLHSMVAILLFCLIFVILD